MDPVFVGKNPEPGSAIARAPAVKKLSRFWIFICLNSNLTRKSLFLSNSLIEITELKLELGVAKKVELE